MFVQRILQLLAIFTSTIAGGQQHSSTTHSSTLQRSKQLAHWVQLSLCSAAAAAAAAAASRLDSIHSTHVLLVPV
jgi:hypothetical protein